MIAVVGDAEHCAWFLSASFDVLVLLFSLLEEFGRLVALTRELLDLKAAHAAKTSKRRDDTLGKSHFERALEVKLDHDLASKAENPQRHGGQSDARGSARERRRQFTPAQVLGRPALLVEAPP